MSQADPGRRTPPLRMLHAAHSMSKASLEYWRKRSTPDIMKSLRPGEGEALRVKADGTVMNGNTRVAVLRARGVDVNSLPRETLP